MIDSREDETNEKRVNRGSEKSCRRGASLAPSSDAYAEVLLSAYSGFSVSIALNTLGSLLHLSATDVF